jgi:hypothetical protein
MACKIPTDCKCNMKSPSLLQPRILVEPRSVDEVASEVEQEQNDALQHELLASPLKRRCGLSLLRLPW